MLAPASAEKVNKVANTGQIRLRPAGFYGLYQLVMALFGFGCLLFGKGLAFFGEF